VIQAGDCFQELHQQAIADADAAWKLALDAEQSAVAVRESEIADLTVALALRSGELTAATGKCSDVTEITLSRKVGLSSDVKFSGCRRHQWSSLHVTWHLQTFAELTTARTVLVDECVLFDSAD